MSPQYGARPHATAMVVRLEVEIYRLRNERPVVSLIERFPPGSSSNFSFSAEFLFNKVLKFQRYPSIVVTEAHEKKASLR